MIITDHLSCFPSHQEKLLIELDHNIQDVHLSSEKLNVIWGAGEWDPVHNTLYCLTLNGWLDHIAQVLRTTQHFWGTKDELSIENSILIEGDCICVPHKLFDCTLADLQESHNGVEKMQSSPVPQCTGQAQTLTLPTMCGDAPSALNTRWTSPSSRCYPETYLTASGRISQPTTSPTFVLLQISSTRVLLSSKISHNTYWLGRSKRLGWFSLDQITSFSCISRVFLTATYYLITNDT